LGIIKFSEQCFVDRIEELNAHLLAVLLDLEDLQQRVGSLCASIFLLVPSEHLLDVLLRQIGWVDQTWDGVIRSELVLNHLVLEMLREEHHDAVGEGVTIFNLHVSLHIEFG
jgi:hypothetical protein